MRTEPYDNPLFSDKENRKEKRVFKEKGYKQVG